MRRNDILQWLWANYQWDWWWRCAVDRWTCAFCRESRPTSTAWSARTNFFGGARHRWSAWEWGSWVDWWTAFFLQRVVAHLQHDEQERTSSEEPGLGDAQHGLSQSPGTPGERSIGDHQYEELELTDAERPYADVSDQPRQHDQQEQVSPNERGLGDAQHEGSELPDAPRGIGRCGDRLGRWALTGVMIGDRMCLQNEPHAASMVNWRSKASTRVCRSTFAGETMACGDALETALFLTGLLISCVEAGIVAEKDAGKKTPLHLMTDCRSLCDHLHREGVPRPPSERRLAVELAAIRQALAVEGRHQWSQRHGEGEVRPDRPLKPPIHWLPTDCQWADISTKKMNSKSWWQLITMYHFQARPSELAAVLAQHTTGTRVVSAWKATLPVGRQP